MKPYAAILASALIAALPLAAQTPVDPKSPIPGFPDGRGPKGPVSIKLVSPAAGEVIPMPAAEAGEAAPEGGRVQGEGAGENNRTFKGGGTGRGERQKHPATNGSILIQAVMVMNTLNKTIRFVPHRGCGRGIIATRSGSSGSFRSMA